MRSGLAVISAIAVISGCAANTMSPPEQNRPPRTLEAPFDGAAELPQADMTDDGPGSLVAVEPLPDIASFDDVNATAVRVVYRSTSGADGQPTQVSGLVVVPAGTPPREGWPVISFGHMVTGVLNRCAPTLAQDVGGYAPILAPLVARGYVVTMTDYQGLGVEGYHHPLLDATTLGNNMIDAVRAARRVIPSASTRWAAYGVGQGGLAAWGAGERAATYGGGLELVGAVALAPFADMSPLADAVQNGTLNPDMYRTHALVLDSLAGPPDALNLDDYRSESARADWDAVTGCALADPAEAENALKRLRPEDLRPATQAATDELRRVLGQYALPGQAPLAAPLLVVYATEDPTMPAPWVDGPVRAACMKNEPLQVFKRVGEANAASPWIIDEVIAWLHARFDGQAIANICMGAW